MVTVAERPAATEAGREMSWGLARFEGRSATESVRRMIREAIVEGRIPPGEQLREARLVEMLGISRGTVREAVRHLVQEGLVEYRMHHGAFVRRRCWKTGWTSMWPVRRSRSGPHARCSKGATEPISPGSRRRSPS